MRSILAEKLLVKIMNWAPERVAQERPLIQAMANLKYDQYQQFSQGIRFTESLAQWLNLFSTSEREVMYQFIKSSLIFISAQQVTHLVNICFAEKINPWLLDKSASQMQISRLLVRKIYQSETYAEIKRRSLFLAISDGAKIDQLRRSSGISNEQVFSSYYISNEKKDDMLNELRNEQIAGNFNSIFLIDDFTGSGLSYFRIEKGAATGKLIKFLKLIYNLGMPENEKSVLSDLIDVNKLDIHIIFYIARKWSLEYLQNNINAWKEEQGLDFSFSVEAIQVIEDSTKDLVINNEPLVEISKKYVGPLIKDRHFVKGKHDEYYLGFDECALPLVLHHNTPNNSLPVLWWYPEDESFRGLFPRITRHRE
jgi:hypothetical protein